MHLVIHFLSFFPLPTKKQRCTADLKEQAEETEQNHEVLMEGKRRVRGFCTALHTIPKTKVTTTNWQPGYNKITILLMTLFLHYLSAEEISKYFSSTTSKPCHHLPLSSFSSLFISMTTNFSQTANVGKVEEMNCPNLVV